VSKLWAGVRQAKPALFLPTGQHDDLLKGREPLMREAFDQLIYGMQAFGLLYLDGLKTNVNFISKRFQIAVLRVARVQLNIHSGDRLVVDIQNCNLILLPQLQNYTAKLQGLHREFWEGVNSNEYTNRECSVWDASQND
jgi:hypothetical protein